MELQEGQKKKLLLVAGTVAAVAGAYYLHRYISTPPSIPKSSSPSSSSTPSASTTASASSSKSTLKGAAASSSSSSSGASAAAAAGGAAGAAKKADKPTASAAGDDSKTAAMRFKDEGNAAYRAKRFPEAVDKYTLALDGIAVKDKECAVFFCNRAACFLAMEKYDKVIEDCTQALALDATYIKAFTRRAKAYAMSDQKQKAIYDYTAVCFIEKFRKSETLKMLDDALKELGREVAEKVLQSRTPSMPSKVTVTTLFDSFTGDFALTANEKESVTELSALVKKSPSDGVVLLRRSIAYLKASRFDESFADVETAVVLLDQAAAKNTADKDLEESKWTARNLRATYLHLRGQDTASLEAFEEIIKERPNDLNARLKRVIILMSMNQTAEAIADLDKMFEENPTNPDVAFHRGQMLLQKQETDPVAMRANLEQAERCFKIAVDQDVKTTSPYVQLAVVEYRLGRTDEGMKRLSRHRSLVGDSPELLVYEAQLYLDRNDIAAANALFDKAIQLDPSYPASYFYRSLAETDPSNALKLLNDCIKADSKFHEAYQSLAQMCIQRGELDQAVSYYDLCLPLIRSLDEAAVIASCREAALAQKHVIRTYPSIPGPTPWAS